MGYIGGKRIQVQCSSRRDCLDLVIKEEVQRKKYLVFMCRETAKQIMLIGEDLLMKPHLKSHKWNFHESDRSFDVEVVPNRRDSSLVIKSTTLDAKKWRRRVFIPEGRYGEGWLSLSRQIREALSNHSQTTTRLPLLGSAAAISSPLPPPPILASWPKITAPRIGSNRLGSWEFMVVCKVDSDFVNWHSIGLRLAEVFKVHGEFDLFPFTTHQAIIIANSAAEQESLCRGNELLTDEDGISLAPWHPSANKISMPQPIAGGWIGIVGLPFHLWHSDIFNIIAAKFGGLLSICDNTRFFNDLSLARIQVVGALGSLPACLEIEDGDEIFQIELRPIMAPDQNPNGMIRVSVPMTTLDNQGEGTPVQQFQKPFSLFTTPNTGEDLNLNSIGGQQLDFPREVRQGLCARPTFKTKSTARHLRPRKTGIWLQRNQVENVPTFIGENSESTHGTEFSVSNSHQEVIASSATSSSREQQNINSTTPVTAGPTSTSRDQQNVNSITPITAGPTSVNSQPSPIDNSAEDHASVPLLLQKENNGTPPTIEQVADFLQIFGIDTRGQNLKLLQEVMNRGQPGLGLFEGLKAYRKSDGGLLLFRPEENALRMQMGATRMCMPSPSVDQFIDAVKQTVIANKRWVPPPGKGSLYMRPLLMGSGPVLGIAPAPDYTFLIYASPVGNYFKEGLAPLNLLVEENYHRAAPGGTGSVKTITNYAPVLKAQQEAKSRGFSDVLYLDSVKNKYLEEVSSCNIFMVKGNNISTPATEGTILSGITRKSIIDIALYHGYQVEERPVEVEELIDADEVFCTGTAVVVAPVGSITYQEKRLEYKTGDGTVSKKLYSTLTGIQMGNVEDKMGWTVEID